MLVWHLKKEWIDRTEDIAAVHIHYVTTPLGAAPDWGSPHERWPMSLIDHPLKDRIAQQTDGHTADVGLRRQTLRLPLHIWDAQRQELTGHYLLHYYYEVFQSNRRWTTDVFCDEIVYHELEYIDWEGRLSAVSLFWSVADWDAPVWMPTEDPRFLASFGDGHERRSNRLYQFPDKSRFAVEKWNLMKQLPLPWRWTGRIYAPKGAVVRQRWHTGNLSPSMDWEDWDPHPPGDFVHFF